MEALVALAVQALTLLLPLLVPFVAVLIQRKAAAVAADDRASRVQKAFAGIAARASTVVAAIEQRRRAAYQEALRDGKISKEEAASLAALAVSDVLDLAAPEAQTLREQGIDPTKAAASAVEAAVYALPGKNRISQLSPAL